MISFKVGIKNLPAEAKNWQIFYFIDSSTCYPTTYEQAPLLTPSESYSFNVADSWKQGFLRYMTYRGPDFNYYIGYRDTNWLTIKNGASYMIDYSTNTVTETAAPIPPTEGFNLEMLLPMFPWEGPPLPRVTGLTWEKLFSGFEFKIPVS